MIQQHKLEPELVKVYAVDFCGTKTLRDAGREQVENFVSATGRLPNCAALCRPILASRTIGAVLVGSALCLPTSVPNFNGLLRENIRLARRTASFSSRAIDLLASITKEFQFSFKAGELQVINGSWYVTHTGLLRLARRKRCRGIHVEAIDSLCDSGANRFVFKATVFPSKGSSGFVGYGDADPSNVSSLVRGAEMRIAETRAVNRALRKAYGIGICSVEEIGTIPNPAEKFPPQNANGNGHGAGPKVRDRLCQIIRQHKLDPELVKAYAVDFCGTKTLREASREQVENFVQQLADRAAKDRSTLLCQLNRYAQPKQEGIA